MDHKHRYSSPETTVKSPQLIMLSVGAIASLVLCQTATAQPPGFQGSYVGIAVEGSSLSENLQNLLEVGNPEVWIVDEALRMYRVQANPSSGTNPETSQDGVGNQFQGRFDLPNSPISVRGVLFLGDEAKGVLPMLSYDLPVDQGTNVYVGAGYAFVRTSGAVTPFGEENGLVLVTGAEAAINEAIVLYGDAKLKPQRESNSGNPVRLQVGVGYRF